jgi:hypothetical protein
LSAEPPLAAWALGPFTRPERLLEARPDLTFDCPVSGREVAWAAKDAEEPTAVIARLAEPFLRVDPVEALGQVGNVCFAQGLIAFQGQWLLYVGLADSRLGLSTAPMRG